MESPDLLKTPVAKSDHNNKKPPASPLLSETPLQLTIEEQLLADLLGANEDLLEALRSYDDLKRLLIEKEAEERSRTDFRADRNVRPHVTNLVL